VGSFIEEAAEDKLVARSVDGAPVTEGHAGLGFGKFQAELGMKAREVGAIDLSGLLGRDAGAVVEGFDGGGGAAMQPGDEIAFGVDAGLQRVAAAGR